MIYNKKELMAMMGDKDWDIKCIAVKNCDGDHDILNDKNILTQAMKDEDSIVRTAAAEKLKEY